MRNSFDGPSIGAATRRAVLPAVALVLGLAHALPAQGEPTDFVFDALLDGKPIGTHRFRISTAPSGREVVLSEAKFEVSVLGIPVYRYRYRDDEVSENGCLASIDAQTDDGGKSTQVRGQVLDDGFELQVRDGDAAPWRSETLSGCVVAFAYWDAQRLLAQKRLLDASRGKATPVAVAATPAGVPAELSVPSPSRLRGLRISGLPQAIDVWYDGERWIGLSTSVGGGRRLVYRPSR